uniref:Uncharacterized protein n=1 Tax=Setaria italica TaxID=4555 RepID=K4AP78_SETIT
MSLRTPFVVLLLCIVLGWTMQTMKLLWSFWKIFICISN